MVTSKEGWVQMDNATKMHYVRKTKSLCGRWMYLGRLFMNPPPLMGLRCQRCNRLRTEEQK